MTPATTDQLTEAQLKRLNRTELEDEARAAGVTDPSDKTKHKTNGDLVDAILEQRGEKASSSQDEVATGGTSDDSPPVGDTSTAEGAAEVEQQASSGPTIDEQREAQLKAGEGLPGADESVALHEGTPAEQRAGYLGARPVDGRVDNMTRRSDADVAEGHFCSINFAAKDGGAEAKKIVAAQLGVDEDALPPTVYGVYVAPGTLGEDGYPLTATVLTRDEHSVQVTVPYSALVPDQAGGRR